jgi:hypothetical protein
LREIPTTLNRIESPMQIVSPSFRVSTSMIFVLEKRSFVLAPGGARSRDHPQLTGRIRQILPNQTNF